MSGNLDLEQLKQEVARRAVDTVLVCFTDMQGRLIGKRVTGHYFIDQ
ncbi:MAG: glutamine synthetase, partial [Geminicoccaceae bacterium]|nr:glutamine synthetase [Geminicoccaceae bacterium]